MKISKLCTVGDSTGMVIARDHLAQLGWFKGDQLQQVVLGDELVIRNLTQRLVKPARRRKDWNDDKLGGARSTGQIRARSN